MEKVYVQEKVLNELVGITKAKEVWFKGERQVVISQKGKWQVGWDLRVKL